MPRINARAKGASGEREFCIWLENTLSLSKRPERNLDQVRSGGGDILSVHPYCFEVKRVENLSLYDAWSQCFFAAQELNRIPIVAFRKNNQPWEFLIPARFIDSALSGHVRLIEPVFKQWIKLHYQRYLSNGP